MLNLPPISININNFTITNQDLDLKIIDHHSRRIVVVLLHPSLKYLLLWRNEEYDNIGDYTQVQVEERILELLGDNPQEKLQSLVI